MGLWNLTDISSFLEEITKQYNGIENYIYNPRIRKQEEGCDENYQNTAFFGDSNTVSY